MLDTPGNPSVIRTACFVVDPKYFITASINTVQAAEVSFVGKWTMMAGMVHDSNIFTTAVPITPGHSGS